MRALKRVPVERDVDVPSALVAPLRETLILLYQATAEALHCSLRAQSQQRGSLEEVHQHRARLAELDQMLGQLGWSPGPTPHNLKLSAAGELLHDAVYGALIDAGERLATTCSSSWRGELTTESVRVAAQEVVALERLLHHIEVKQNS
jgi:hypothetical protein